MKILIIGLGSIAKKHIEILKNLNQSFIFYALRSKKDSVKHKGVLNIYSFSEIKNHSFYFAIISSPSFLHKEHLIKIVELNIPILIEKPLCISKKQLNEIEKIKTSSIIYLGYNLRFHPLIIFMKEYLKKNTPKVLEINAYCGSYLPSWRKSNHKSNYSSYKKQGGGVFLDLSHEMDYIFYLFETPKKINKKLKKVTDITHDTEDFAHIYMNYKKFFVSIVLNYYRRDKKRTLEIVTDKNTLMVDFIKGNIKDLLSNTILYRSKEDLMLLSYENQIKYWLTCIEKNNVPTNSLEEAIINSKLIL
tara:strand:+ start:640 stop:1551 length:912 start_codon:yes stop_codon:yes gene_type:complete